jgi:DNA-binding NarL/FixJ family response regulator
VLADITGLIGVLVWPALVVVVVMLFRKPLNRLLSGSLTVKGSDGLEISASSRQQAATALTQATAAKGAPPMGQRNPPYDVVVSDMERHTQPQAGYDLLEKLRSAGVHTPFIVYARSGRPEHFDEAVRHGAEGWADTPEELMQMVLAAVRRVRGGTPGIRSGRRRPGRRPRPGCAAPAPSARSWTGALRTAP